jgi:hypothetical protein
MTRNKELLFFLDYSQLAFREKERGENTGYAEDRE